MAWRPETVALDRDGTRTDLIYENGVPILRRNLPNAVRDRQISANRARQNEPSVDGNGLRHVASLDQAMCWECYKIWTKGKAKKGGLGAMLKDQEFMWRVLNDPDYQWMRVSRGAEGPRSTHRPRKHFIIGGTCP